MRFKAFPVACVAIAVAVVATFVAGLLLEGYAWARHPLAWLGATGDARAMGFNAFALVFPGLLLAGVAWQFREALEGCGWAARLGAWLLLLSALAFAGLGLMPLDASDLVSEANRRHAVAWSLWWMASVPGALLVAAGLPARLRAPGLRLVAAFAAFAVGACALGMGAWLPTGVSQRIAVLAWLATLAMAAKVADRDRIDAAQP